MAASNGTCFEGTRYGELRRHTALRTRESLGTGDGGELGGNEMKMNERVPENTHDQCGDGVSQKHARRAGLYQGFRSEAARVDAPQLEALHKANIPSCFFFFSASRVLIEEATPISQETSR